MLKQKYRLKKKYQFNYTFKTGQSKASKNIIIYYTKSKNKNIKIGLSVTKKVGNAVIRNHTKRLLRVAVFPFLSNLKNNFNLIIVARPGIVTCNLNQIKSELEILLNKAGLICDKPV